MSRKLFPLLFFFTAIILQTNLYSQPTEEWVRTYISGYPNNDAINAMALDTNGNVIVTGVVGIPAQNGNFCTIKYNNSGVQEWVAFYNGPGSNSIDMAIAIAVDKRGYIYVTGLSEETGFGTDAYCTIKYSPSGTQMWAARYHRTPHYYDEPEAIAVDKNGNVYITGKSSSNGTYDGYDYLTIKYDSIGVLKWARYYDGPANHSDLAHSIAIDNNDDIYITGESSTFPFTGGYCTIKYNTNGDSIWVRRYDGFDGHPNLGLKLLIDKYNNTYVTGISYTAIAPEYCTIKYNSTGVQQWISNYRSPTNGSSEPFAIAIDSNLNVVVTGRSFAGSTPEYATVKYNSSGIQQWVRIFNGPGNSYDEPHDICTDTQGNCYVTGRTQDINQNWLFTTIKYNSSGVQEWLMNHDGIPEVIKIDKNNNVFVAGKSLSPSKFTIIKYTQYVGISNFNEKESKNFFLLQNFPNPFNPLTRIKYSINKTSFVKLNLYNILGKAVCCLLNGKQNKGIYEISWNGENFPSGIYFYTLSTDDYSETRKMLLIK